MTQYDMNTLHRFVMRQLIITACLLALATSLAQADITTGLVGWWKMSDGNAATAPDSSGNEYPFSMQGGTGPVTIAGRSGMGFDGVDEFGANTNAPFATNPFTIASWIYLESGGPSTSTILSNGRIVITATLVAGSSPARSSITGTINTTSGSTTLSAGELEHGAWHHIAVCHSATQSTMYLDGQMQTSGVAAASLVTGFSLGIGRNPQTGSQYYRGNLSDLRYYNRVLTAGDINELITGAIPPPDITTGLVGWWKMTEGSGTNIPDSSGNNNAGTITGATWSERHGQKCLVFDGNDKVTIQDSASLTSSTITMAAWVDAPSSPGYGAVMDRAGYVPGWTPMSCAMMFHDNSSVTQDGQTFNVLNGELSISSSINGNSRSVTAQISHNRWHHIVVIAGATGTKIYRDGILQSSAASSTLQIGNGYGLYLGYRLTNGSYFSGAMRDVRYYNRGLLAADVAALFANDLSPKPQSLYTFNESSLQESSGNGFHGSTSGTPSYVLGAVGKGLSLSGSTQTIDAGPDVRMEQATVAAFVRVDGTPTGITTQSITSSWASDPNFNLAWSRDATGKNVFIAKFRKRLDTTHAYPEQSVTSQTSFALGVFHHVALSYDGTTLKLYVNGRLEGTDSALGELAVTPVSAQPNIEIGGSSMGVSSVVWTVDDVRIYDRSLSEGEIAPFASGVDGKLVYFEDFQNPEGVSQTWENITSIGNTPGGSGRSTKFIGPLHNSSGNLKVPLLPEHSSVTVGFDLYLKGNWRGGGTNLSNEDRLWVGLANGNFTTPDATTFNTTFSTIAGTAQQFPSSGSTFANQPFTGAYERNTLGYGTDQVIRVVRTFPHTSSALALHFRRLYPLGNTDGHWSIDNVAVSVSQGAIPAYAFSLAGELTSSGLPAGTIRMEATSGIATDKLTATQLGAYAFSSLTSHQTYRVLAYVDSNDNSIRDPYEWVGAANGGSLSLDNNKTGINIEIEPPIDTDSDGMSDEWELTNDLVVGINDSNLDKDGDGLNNIQEYTLGTTVRVVDTDGDGVNDGREWLKGMSALSIDSDGDGMSDAYEVANGLNPLLNDTTEDADFDGMSNLAEFTAGTKANSADSNSDGVSDYRQINGKGFWKAYYDKNNRFIGQLFDNGASLIQGYDANGNPTRHILRQGSDKDGDGLLDIWEVANGLDPNLAAGANGIGDADNDGVSNLQEYVANTDPKSATSKTTNDGTVIATSSAFPWTPSNYVMGTGQLDGTGIEEVIISGDGNPGSVTNVLKIFTPNAAGTTWTEETVPLGTVGVTSICVGHTNAANTIFIGTRAVIPAFGQIIKFTKNAGVWTPTVTATSTDQVAFVVGFTNWNSGKLIAQYSAAGTTQFLHHIEPSTLTEAQFDTYQDLLAWGPHMARDAGNGITFVRRINLGGTDNRFSIWALSADYNSSNQSPTLTAQTALKDLPFISTGITHGSRHPYLPAIVQYRMVDKNTSGQADDGDEMSLIESNHNDIILTDSPISLFDPTIAKTALGTVFPSGANKASVILASDASGAVNLWVDTAINNSAMQRHLLSGAYRAKTWHEFRSLRGMGTGESAVGLCVGLTTPTMPELVLWTAPALAANASANPLQNAPIARVAATPSAGGPQSLVDVDIWDAEANPSRMAMQYRQNAWSSWSNATVLTVDGNSPATFVAATPGGSRHTLLWNAAADLGNGFAGNVLLRVRATDSADAGTWSEQAYFRVAATPEIAVRDLGSNLDLIDNGAGINLGEITVGRPITRSFRISNEGNAALDSIALTGNASAGAGMNLPALTSSVSGGSSQEFSATFIPTTAGAHSATLQIASTDADESPFEIALSFTAVQHIITVAVTPTSVSEDGGNTLTYTFSRSSSADVLSVGYTLDGTATAGVDYAATPSNAVNFDPGSTTAQLVVTPTSDGDHEPDETVIVSVLGGQTEFIPGTPASATGGILADELPTVVTALPGSITPSSAGVGGQVTVSGTNVTERGVLYSTNPVVTIVSGTKLLLGAGTGSYSTTLANLSQATTYYVRAYAINSAGTGYGNTLNFTTTTVPSGPGWTSPTGLENSMTIYAQVDREGSKIESTGSRLAAFQSNAVAGVAAPITGPGGIKLYQMTAWSNAASATMPMKVYDAGSDEVLDIQETLAFTANGVLGTIAAPVLLHVRPPTVDQVIPLVQGMNWISFNALPASHTVSSVLSQHTPQDNDLIKGTQGTATYFGGTWYPTSGFTLEPGWMYILRRQAAGSANLTVTGEPVDTTASIPLVAGWNWLGYNPQAPRQISQALAGLSPSNNDLIKGQYNGSATFFDGEWYARSYELSPGRGYLIKLTTAQSFAYDTSPSAMPSPTPITNEGEDLTPFPGGEVEESEAPAAAVPNWQAPSGKENSMTIYAVVEIGGQRVEASDAQLAILEGSQVAGAATIMQGPTGKLYQLTAWSDASSNPTMILKAYDPSISIIRDLVPTITFAANGVEGGIASPTVFSAPALTPIEVWRHTHFGTISNSSIAADTSDDDGDGIANLLEYATSMAPKAHDHLPISCSKPGPDIEFVYARNTQATDVTMTVEWSDTLGDDWSSAGITTSIISDTGTVQQIKALIPAGGARRFVHLKITRP